MSIEQVITYTKDILHVLHEIALSRSLDAHRHLLTAIRNRTDLALRDLK